MSEPTFNPKTDISTHWSIGNVYVEVTLKDLDTESLASTGYLDWNERLAVAERLREIASELEKVP